MMFQILMVLFLVNFINGNHNSCGNAPSSSSARNKRVVGGSLAPNGSWPWLAELNCILGYIQCGGTLVTKRWVVTAANCFNNYTDPDLWRVWIKDNDQNNLELFIDDIIIHPEFSGYQDEDIVNHIDFNEDMNNIALIRLREDVKQEPICLPPNQEIADENHGECWVAGNGLTMVDEIDGAVINRKMHQVSGPLVSSTNCSQMWNMNLPNTVMCFGDWKYGTCDYDDGAPVMCQGTNGRYTLEGITSVPNCNETFFPTVFTRARSYISWIHKHVN